MSDRFYRLGCDIGGTFTDFVLLNDRTGDIKINKCLTTPSDPSDAVEQGIRQLEQMAPAFVQELDEVIHGTTLVINSIIERKLYENHPSKIAIKTLAEINFEKLSDFKKYNEPRISKETHQFI